MKSKRRHVVVRSQKPANLLSLDFWKSKKTPFHGAALGLVLVVAGLLIMVSLVTLIGLVIFVPSVGAMVIKFFKTKIAKV